MSEHIHSKVKWDGSRMRSYGSTFGYARARRDINLFAQITSESSSLAWQFNHVHKTFPLLFQEPFCVELLLCEFVSIMTFP